jgi:hypothetical protein
MHRKAPPTLLPWLLCLALTAFFLPAAAAEEEKKEAKEEQKAEEQADPAGAGADAHADPEQESSETRVFTNEDLERLFGGGELDEEPARPSGEGSPAAGEAAVQRPAGPATGGGAQAADPLQWMQQRETSEAERRQQIADAEAAVAAARQKVADLEKRLLAVKNPFLARPEIPDDEKSDWDGMSGPERASATEEQLGNARDELQKAEQELARLRSQS